MATVLLIKAFPFSHVFDVDFNMGCMHSLGLLFLFDIISVLFLAAVAFGLLIREASKNTSLF